MATGGGAEGVVTFDQSIVAGELDTLNWTQVHSGFGWVCDFAEAVGNQVLLEWSPTEITGGPDRVSYDAAPADVIGSVGGLPAAAFADFPILP